jgi:hypothetical protein
LSNELETEACDGRTEGRTSIARQLSAASLAINNTLNDTELQALVAIYGYTAAKISEGQQIYLTAAGAVNTQTIAGGAQRQATLHARTAEQQARANYQALAQVARAVFMRNAAALAMLGLSGAMPSGTAEFIAAANTLFDNALNVRELSTSLATNGYDQARLTHERAAIATFDQANQAQIAAIGAAQQATRDQKAALTAQAEWLAQYLKIAKIALRDKPQLLEKLGGVARSSRTAALRQVPKKAAATRAARKAA